MRVHFLCPSRKCPEGTTINDLGEGLEEIFGGHPPGKRFFLESPSPGKKILKATIRKKSFSDRPSLRKNNFRDLFAERKKFWPLFK